MSVVLTVLDILGEDQWMMGTIPDRSKPTSSLHSRISNFLTGDKAQAAFHSAASKAFNVVKNNHKAVLKGALAVTLHHFAEEHGLAGAIPSDLEDHVHHQISHVAQTLSVTKDMAHHMLTHAVGKLKAARGITEETQDELDRALIELHKMLKKLEPHYRAGKQDRGGNNNAVQSTPRPIQRNN
jgi:hypothetical protein